jgi:hypothetical protein
MQAKLTREGVFAGGLFALVLCFAAFTLAAGRVALSDYLAFVLAYVRVAAGLWVFTGTVAIGWVLVRERRGGGRRPLTALLTDLLQRRWREDRLLSMIAPPLLFALLMASFNAFKQRVLPQAGFGMDVPLAEIDRALFLGVDPWKLTHGLFDSPWASWAIDLSYHAWFAPMALGVMACAFLPAGADALRYRYLTSYVLLWLIGGSLLALAMPAAGPCFQPGGLGGAAGFEPLMDRLGAQHDWLVGQGMSGLSALQYQDTLFTLFGGRELAIGAGISAMPSMHNGLAVLFAIAAFRVNRIAGMVLAAYALLIWIGSVHLGWHYAVDGPVAALVAVVAWRLSGPVAAMLMADEWRPLRIAFKAR